MAGDEENNERIVTEIEPLLGRPDSVKNLAEADTDKFPDGGRGWWVVLGTFLALNSSFGMCSSYGVYQLYYQDKFPDIKPSSISLIGALQPFMIYLSSIPTVTLINAIGVQRTVCVGFSIMIVAMWLIPLCQTLQQLYLCQGIMFGVGAGILYFISMSLPSEWFKIKRASAIGITSSGASLGGMIWPTVLQKLTETIGFSNANRTIALIYIPFMFVSALMVKSRFPKKRNSILPKVSVLKEKKFVAILIANAVGMFGHFAPLFYIYSYATKLPTVRPFVAAKVLVLMNAFSGVGRTLPSFLADKIGRLNMLIFCVFLTGFSQYAFWIPARGEGMLITFAILWGIGSGSFTALMSPTICQLFGIEDNQSRLSFFFLLSTFGSVLGPYIFGSFLPDKTKTIEGYTNAALFSGGAMLLASFILLGVRLKYSTKLRVFI